MYRFLDFCDGLEAHVFLVFLIYSRASVPGLLSSYDSWINLSSEETLQWFVFSIIHNIRLAPHCAGPLVVTAPPGLQKNNHSRRRGWVPKCFQCGASPVTHTVMSSFCFCSEPIYYVEQIIKKIYPTIATWHVGRHSDTSQCTLIISTQSSLLYCACVFHLTRAFMCGIIATRMACGQIYFKKISSGFWSLKKSEIAKTSLKKPILPTPSPPP